MSEEITTLELGTFSTMSFKLHPSVPLQMMEFYYRKKSTYMIGALLGHIESTHVSITNCYAIPLLQSEDDDSGEYYLDKDYHRKMYDLNRKVNPGETLVGWFSDLPEMDIEVAMFHQYFASKESHFTGKAHVFTQPLIVLVEPFSKKSIFGLRGFIHQSMSVCRDSFGIFQEVDLIYEFSKENTNEITPLFLDKTELKDQEKGNPFGLINLDNLEGQLKESQANVQKLLAYVKDVNAGKE
mmetsp:Transcript_34934/g.31477  ORF Transcript_34934/g.31477 Transcript_34934/m.31477 type:complete len:240 (+) Transcript_34934:34-753(+)